MNDEKERVKKAIMWNIIHKCDRLTPEQRVDICRIIDEEFNGVTVARKEQQI